MKLWKLIYENEYSCEKKIPSDMEIEDIASRLEEISENSLFILIESIKFDIKNILKNIETKSPKAIICDEKFTIEKANCYILYVKNPRKIMSYVYSRFYSINYEKMKFIGITGTNGKTSTATLIKHILDTANEKVGFIGTGKIEIGNFKISEENYSMTTPDPNLLYYSISKMEKENCKYVIMEVSSHALYFDKLAPIPFEIGIFTNLSPEHLDFHKSIEEYYQAKLKLFSQCKIGIFNCDDKYSKRAISEVKCNSLSIGILWSADVMAREIVENGFLGIEYIYREPSLLFKLNLPLPGSYNIYNSMFALKTAILLGIRPCVAKTALSAIKGIDGRFQIIKDKVTVIVDYAHTPFALENLLKSINYLKKPKQKITVVFGCGGDRDKYKRPLMGSIAESLCDFSIITNDNPRTESESEIIKDILEGYLDTEKRKVITSRKNAIEYAIQMSDDDDIIAVVGKGCEKYNIDKDGYHSFDEIGIIKNALKRRNRKEEDNENTTRDTINY